MSDCIGFVGCVDLKKYMCHQCTWVSMKWVDFSSDFSDCVNSILARNIMFCKHTEESDSSNKMQKLVHNFFPQM